MEKRRKFVPRATKREICVEAGRRGGTNAQKNRALPRIVRTLAEIPRREKDEDRST